MPHRRAEILDIDDAAYDHLFDYREHDYDPRSENLVVLLHAIEKDTGAVPRSAIELAKRRMADFKRRMDAERRVPPRAAGQDVPPTRRRRS